MEQLCRRFDGLSENQTCHELLGSDAVTEEFARRRLFAEIPF